MTSTKPRPSGGRPTSARVAQIDHAIVAATIEAFARHGGDFGMDQVAALAGVSKQAIYRRFDGKVDLLCHAIDSILATDLQEALQDLPDDPVAALRAVAWGLFDDDHAQRHRVAIFLQAEALRDDTLRRHLLGWENLRAAPYRALLRNVHAAGRAADVDSEVQIHRQAELLVELLSGATSRLAMKGLFSPEDKARMFEERWNVFTRMALC